MSVGMALILKYPLYWSRDEPCLKIWSLIATAIPDMMMMVIAASKVEFDEPEKIDHGGW